MSCCRTRTSRISSRNYQKLIAKIEGKPEERILSYLMLRSLKQARYSDENTGHFALAAPSYTHFTSPIRRYPDLMVHRILSELSRPPAWPAGETALRRAGRGLLASRNAGRRTRNESWWSGRKSSSWQDRVGEEFNALIISITKFGFFVELENLFVEGLVPMDTLPGRPFPLSGKRAQDCGRPHAQDVLHWRCGAGGT